MIVKYNINGSYCNILYMRLKTELYPKEQDHIIDTIISILGITQENNCITLYEIEHFNEIKLQLMGLMLYKRWRDQVIYVEQVIIPFQRMVNNQNVHSSERNKSRRFIIAFNPQF